MAIHIQVNILEDSLMVKANIPGSKDKSILVISKMVLNMDEENGVAQKIKFVILMKVNILKISDKERVYFNGQVEMYTKASI